MTKTVIKATVGTREDMAAEFIKTWHQIEAGENTKSLGEKIYFEDERTLFRALSPKRCDLLRYVHKVGEMSILSLAKQLKRDYKNVYQDVKELNQIGLLVKNSETGKYFVPWSSIVTEIPMNYPTENNYVGRRSKHFSSKKAA